MNDHDLFLTWMESQYAATMEANSVLSSSGGSGMKSCARKRYGFGRALVNYCQQPKIERDIHDAQHSLSAWTSEAITGIISRPARAPPGGGQCICGHHRTS